MQALRHRAGDGVSIAVEEWLGRVGRLAYELQGVGAKYRIAISVAGVDVAEYEGPSPPVDEIARPLPPTNGDERKHIHIYPADGEPCRCGDVHTHQWKIETPNGPTSQGHCDGCGETRVFRNSDAAALEAKPLAERPHRFESGAMGPKGRRLCSVCGNGPPAVQHRGMGRRQYAEAVGG